MGKCHEVQPHREADGSQGILFRPDLGKTQERDLTMGLWRGDGWEADSSLGMLRDETERGQSCWLLLLPPQGKDIKQLSHFICQPALQCPSCYPKAGSE